MVDRSSSCPASPPIDGRAWVGDRYERRPSGDLHTAIDLGAPEGTPVLAVLPGRVVRAYESGEMRLYGHTVVIEHLPRELYSLSAHLESRPPVRGGEHVMAGQMIGAVGRSAGTREDPGRTFDTDAAHLHLEFLDRWPPRGPDLDRLDPEPILARLGIRLGRALEVEPGSPAACAVAELERQASRSPSDASDATPSAGARGAAAGASGARGGSGGADLLPLLAIAWWLAKRK